MSAQPPRHAWHKCSVCGKRAYDTRAMARDARRCIKGHGKARDPKPEMRLNVYPSCDGYGWHIGHTSKD